MIIFKTFIIFLLISFAAGRPSSAIVLLSRNSSGILFSDKTQHRLHLSRHFSLSSLPSDVSHTDSFLPLHLFVSFASALAGTSGTYELLAAMLVTQTSGVWPLLHR